MAEFNEGQEAANALEDAKEGFQNIGHAAADAVRHNWVGAAITVVKNRRNILIAIAISLMIPFIIFVAIPTALFHDGLETPEQWVESYKEIVKKCSSSINDGYSDFVKDALKKGEEVKEQYGSAGDEITVSVQPSLNNLELSSRITNQMMAIYHTVKYYSDDTIDESDLSIYSQEFDSKVKDFTSKTGDSSLLFTIKDIKENIYSYDVTDEDGNTETFYRGTIVVNVQLRPESFMRDELNEVLVAEGGRARKIMGVSLKDATPTQRSIVQAASETEWPGPQLCSEWVTAVYENAGLPGYGGDACDMWAEHCYTDDKSELAPGMMIAVQHSGSHGYSWIYGHVGIYMGDGNVIHSVTHGVTIDPLDQWIDTFDAFGTVKWGYPEAVRQQIESEEKSVDYTIVSDADQHEANEVNERIFQQIDDVKAYLDAEFEEIYPASQRLRSAAVFVNAASSLIGKSKWEILQIFRANAKMEPDDNWDCEFVVAAAYSSGLNDAGVIFPVTASTEHLYLRMKSAGTITDKDSKPRTGYLIFFGQGENMRVGIVDRYYADSDTIYVIEGNVDGKVAAKKYSASDGSITGYGIPNFPEVEGMGDDIVEVATNEMNRARDAGEVGGYVYWDWDRTTYEYFEQVGVTPNWCALFVSWCAEQLGYCSAGYFPKTWGVYAYTDWFYTHGEYGEVHNRDGYTPQPGDLVIYDWSGSGAQDHIEIVTGYDESRYAFQSIGGNTGINGAPGRYCNYSLVADHDYNVGAGVVWGFIHPYYENFN